MKTNKFVYVTPEVYAALITDGSVEVGGVTYTYDANNTYMVQENGLEGVLVQSTGATSGQVLTANGSGGASWQTASSGSGDVTASGTLSVGAVMLGLGSKTITASNGTNGKFLGWSGGATWQGLYLHTIHVTRTQSPNTPVEMYFSFISTQSAAYTSMGNVPNGFYVASGNIDQTGFNEGQCRVLYYDRSHDTIGYWKSVSNALATTNLTWNQTSVTITDTVSQIS